MYKRIYKFSIPATAALSFIGWHSVADSNIKQYFNVLLMTLNLPNNILNTLSIIFIYISRIILTYGFFVTINALIISGANNNVLIKKLLFGEKYIEGVWVGYYVKENSDNKSDEVFISIEVIEQNIDSISVCGYSYDLNFKLAVNWTNYGHPILYEGNRLEFIYLNDRHSDAKCCYGISIFQLNRISPNKPPESLFGYSISVDKPAKAMTVERKISSLPCKDSEFELFEKGLEVFKENNPKFFDTNEFGIANR